MLKHFPCTNKTICINTYHNYNLFQIISYHPTCIIKIRTGFSAIQEAENKGQKRGPNIIKLDENYFISECILQNHN